MSHFISSKSKQLSATVKADQNSTTLSDLKNTLLGKNIVAIEAHVDTDCAVTLKNEAVATASMLKGAYLILQTEGQTVFQEIHMYNLLRSNNNGMPYQIEKRKISWANSSIDIPDASTNDESKSYVITVHYTD